MTVDHLSLNVVNPIGFASSPERIRQETPATNLLAAAWRRKGLLALIVTVSAGMGVVALSVMKPQYTAEALLQLNLDKHEGTQPEGAAMVLDGNLVVQSELKVLRSRIIARRVVDRLHLADDEYRDATSVHVAAEKVVSSIGLAAWIDDGWQAAVTYAAGWLRGPTTSTGSETRDPMKQREEAAADRIMSHLTVDSDNRSYVVTIRYVADNPDRAARVANAIAEAYIQRRLEANSDGAGKTAEWLETQIKSTTGLLAEAENTVEAYREQSGLIELGTSETLNQQQLRNLSTQLSAAVAARIDAEAKLIRIQRLGNSGTVPSATDLQGSPLVQSLVERKAAAQRDLAIALARFGVNHPMAVQAQAELTAVNGVLNAELRRAASVMQSDVTAAQRAELDLQTRLGALQRSMIAGKSNESELHSRQVAAQAIRERLAALTRSRDQALAQQQLRSVAATLIVPAEPVQTPSFPKPSVVIPLTTGCGLALALALATLLERRDRGLLSSDEVEPTMGARCLGMVPEISHSVISGQGSRRKHALQRSLLAESARSVGAAAGLFGRNEECTVVLVTSSVGGEGKSTLCHALAKSLVVAGQRVLLVDGSPWRDEEAPPAETVVRSSAASDIAVQPSRMEEQPLTILKRSCPGWLATDVFGSGGFVRLLDQARKHFNVIILEGPPVMLVADSLVLGRVADRVIHVARWSSTKRRVVDAALQRLYESSIVVDGVVLTRVKLGRHAGFKFIDQCLYYLKERKFYEQLSSQGRTRVPKFSWMD